ncbi:selenocysteine-specific translation elongation factor [Fictibacillus fluitans]|uniref:Selenocysteine-specific elongation factor n=1 Tax=Fictibacillus fluitans TaxID=3058422 RepID=A0ABT8HR83_9BACL|nr:selenocysteine-specific translation elongation factor [Fictibacillus sp. NE201]MDN4523272.1 selenocysteine-specific translation elongation factor [Fictibacillus sp. NE201]
MAAKHVTIGIAGHIDHGKTALTKALSQVDTDTLKEEKERGITIEPGIAPFSLNENISAAIIDVPGHEKFIRQMIAGVAGIDLVILVIAADEGIMPQTVEHFEILQFLGITNTVCAVTKSDNVDSEWKELLSDEIQGLIKGTALEEFPIHFVDSLSGAGIESLKNELVQMAQSVPPKSLSGPFRLPVDQAFTVKGQGTVVRGTIVEGRVSTGDLVALMPGEKHVRVRQLQVHNEAAETAGAGQRAAMNLAGLSREEVTRGHVLVSPGQYPVSDCLDVLLILGNNAKNLKQRQHIKFYIGTSEVMGKIVFFDRNEAREKEGDIYCQVRLSNPVVARKGDRFILRRPSPEETIGGGEVIDPMGESYRFGMATVDQLKKKREGTPLEWAKRELERNGALSEAELYTVLGRKEDSSDRVHELLSTSFITEIQKGVYALTEKVDEMKGELIYRIQSYHRHHPLRQGMDKAELLHSFREEKGNLIQYSLNSLLSEGVLGQENQFIRNHSFAPHVPKEWEKRFDQLENLLLRQGVEAQPFSELYGEGQLPENLYRDYAGFLISSGAAYQLEDDRLIHALVVNRQMGALKKTFPESFSVQEAKAVLEVSRKYLIPYLELLDRIGYTLREEGRRRWKNKKTPK